LFNKLNINELLKNYQLICDENNLLKEENTIIKNELNTIVEHNNQLIKNLSNERMFEYILIELNNIHEQLSYVRKHPNLTIPN